MYNYYNKMGWGGDKTDYSECSREECEMNNIDFEDAHQSCEKDCEFCNGEFNCEEEDIPMEEDKIKLDNETKYLVAKQWVGDIIFKSRMAGNPIFKDKEYKVILNKVLNDFYKLEYKETTSS